MRQEKIKKLISDRASREINLLLVEGRPMPQSFLLGYLEAAKDLYWDLFDVALVLPEEEEMRKRYETKEVINSEISC